MMLNWSGRSPTLANKFEVMLFSTKRKKTAELCGVLNEHFNRVKPHWLLFSPYPTTLRGSCAILLVEKSMEVTRFISAREKVLLEQNMVNILSKINKNQFCLPWKQVLENWILTHLLPWETKISFVSHGSKCVRIQFSSWKLLFKMWLFLNVAQTYQWWFWFMAGVRTRHTRGWRTTKKTKEPRDRKSLTNPQPRLNQREHIWGSYTELNP